MKPDTANKEFQAAEIPPGANGRIWLASSRLVPHALGMDGKPNSPAGGEARGIFAQEKRGMVTTRGATVRQVSDLPPSAVRVFQRLPQTKK